MTREQKRLLWTVPVAVAIFGGLIAYQYDRMGKVTDRLVEVPTTPPPNVEQVRRATEQLQAASDLAILNASERQLVKDEEFVRSVETAYPALRQARRDEERKRVASRSTTPPRLWPDGWQPSGASAARVCRPRTGSGWPPHSRCVRS